MTVAQTTHPRTTRTKGPAVTDIVDAPAPAKPNTSLRRKVSGGVATTLAGDYYRHCNSCPVCDFHAAPIDCVAGSRLHGLWWRAES